MSRQFDAGLVLCALAEVQDGGTRGFTLGDGDWPLRGLVVRHGDTAVAFVNQCPHAGHRLNFLPDRFLTPDGGRILCLSHGAQFDKRSGECVAGPCVGEALRPIPVEVADGCVRLAAAVDADALMTRWW
ncbi:MAG: hypothetical protein RL026_2037 [Pseudomonadota bacterium]|jgi:nitrite reductase/ring-hydroxylating ferredoxin subunit